MRGDKQERILRVLLNSKEALSKNNISKRSDCSRQWVILFLKKLQQKKIIKGTTLIDRKKLFKYWISISKKRKYRSYMVKEPLMLLKRSKLNYALTTYQAENLVQHYLFPSRIDLYIHENDLNAWHALMTKNGLYGKGNVRIIITDEHVMYGKIRIKGLSIVSLPQLIVDLIKEGGPCQEAAEMFMKRIE
jgi:DNA-binding Lrp family transcriptional regulator